MSSRLIKRYSELITLSTFEERFLYLKLGGKVGEETFGSRRWLNQRLYHSQEWLSFRDGIIVRDLGRDLAVEGYDIFGAVTIHHINPISVDDILEENPIILDSENAVCVSSITHKAIHYGDEGLIPKTPVERRAGDTCPWKN